MSKCRIVCIGNELLIGEVINTNATYIAKQLNRKGYFVDRILCIRDDYNEILWAINEAKKDCVKYLILTGGLGPTYDDITIESVAKILGRELILHQETLKKLEERAKARGHPLAEASKKMAYVPKDCNIITNSRGVAPGVDASVNGLRIFVLPGVPSEMKCMMKEYVLKVLPDRGKYYEKKMTLEGIGESMLAETLKQIVVKYSDIYLKTHPRPYRGKYRLILHVYVRDTLSPIAIEHVNEAVEVIRQKFGQHIIKIR
ncbi:MAG: molybdopterin-binding protein [Nitrososphaeria archaeon]|nr:molybdopterin-binding protein [Nitrososphaeria archaeon]